MKKLLFDANVTSFLVSSGGNFVSKFRNEVNGDSVLFASHFTETIGTATKTDLDLTDGGAPLSLRLTVRSARDTDSRLWGFQDSFNQGNYVAGENLPEGRVTWLVNFGFMSYAITGVTASTFVIAGDFTDQIKKDDIFTVSGSTGNDGDYTISIATTYASGPDETTITVAEAVPDLTVDGTIDHSALDNDLIAKNPDNTTSKAVNGWVEVSYVDANAIPQTLMQLPIQFYDELDNGANSVSAGAQPTYLTATEILADFVSGAGVVTDNAMVIFDGTGGVTIQEPNDDINALTQKIINVVDPTALQDVATKNYVDSASGGDVFGPGSSTDNAIARFDLTTGKILLDSPYTTIDDNGGIVATSNAVGTTNLQLNMAASQTANPFIIKDSSGNNTLSYSTGEVLQLGFDTSSGTPEIRTTKDHSSANTVIAIDRHEWNGNTVGFVQWLSGLDTVNKDDGHVKWFTYEGGSATAALHLAQDGQVFMHAEAAAPADGEFANSEWTIWLDESNDEFELKAKKSGGGIITQTIGSGGGGLTFLEVTGTGTASNGDEIGADTSGGAYTYNLPATPTANDRVRFMDIGAAWASNNLTIGRNGETIRGAAADFTGDVDSAWVEFVYNGTSSTWEYRTP